MKSVMSSPSYLIGSAGISSMENDFLSFNI